MKVPIVPVLMAVLASAGIAARPSASSVRVAPELQNASPSGTRSVWDGVYSEAQASRGESTYLDECARCHGESLVGTGDSGPPLSGDAFIRGWSSKSVGDLFERVRTTMPQDTPGRLTRQQTADVVAYVLRGNEFPAGQAALEPDLATLQTVKFQGKTGQRP